MKPRSRDVLLFTAAVAALWLAGCGSSPQPRLYVLSPSAGAGGPAGGGLGLAVGVGPVTVAPHLDRPQIVTRRGSELQLSELERWAEPLADGIARTLAEDLGALLATDRLWLYPWPPSVPVDVQVTVDVLRFDQEGGDGVLAARWTVTDADGRFATRRFERREPAAEPERAATVEALSRALAELSREIAGTLAERAAADGG